MSWASGRRAAVIAWLLLFLAPFVYSQTAKPSLDTEALRVAMVRLKGSRASVDDLRSLLGDLETSRATGCGRECMRLWDLVTAKSSEQGIYSSLTVRTKVPGAYVKFQSVGDRSRSEPALSMKTPTNTAPEEVPIGSYYVWAERRGRLASDPNFRVRLVGITEEVTLDEQQQRREH
jgi:hypothetical protein